MEPSVQYTTSFDGARIAYTVTGQGPPLIFLADSLASHVQMERTAAVFGAAYAGVAESFTFVRLDLRGSGLSDRDVADLSAQAMAADIDAVAMRLGLESHALTAMQDTTPAAITYAAAHPDRVSHLVLIDGFARGAELMAQPQSRALAALAANDWELFSESIGAVVFGFGSEETQGYAEFVRASVAQETVPRLIAAWNATDVTDELPKLSMPVLILHHEGLKFVSVDMARDLAARIPDARLVLLPGLWNDRRLAVAHRIAEFAGVAPVQSPPEDGIASATSAAGVRAILFTDIEGHTSMMQRLGDERGRAVLRQHERITRDLLRQHGGAEVKTIGDAFMAAFNSVSAAAHCATALQRAFSETAVGGERLAIRVGINAGEPVAEDGDLFGSSVILASRLEARAKGGEILVSDTVRGLLSGKGFLFSDRGEVALRGFEDPVRIYELRWRDA